MTTVPRQLAIFAGVLALLYGGGYAAGQIIDADAPGGHGSMSNGHSSSTADEEGGHGTMAMDAEAHGLSASENGLRLSVNATGIQPGQPQRIAFQVLDDTGSPVTDYDTTHTKKMHMILVRRDLTGFQHLHPTQDDAGLWQAQATIKDPGSYRLYADFSHAGEKTTLAGDVRVDGEASAQPLPAPAPVATTGGGFTVRIDSDAAEAGEETTLSFVVNKNGHAVETQPYLGAGGHLVALRQGDMAFLHVHPTEGTISFETTFPSAGTYRLFLQFKVDGRVETAAFTHEVS